MPERRFLQEGKANFKRSINRFEPRQQFLIVCEGKKTEPNYFKKFPIPPDSVVDVEGLGANTDSLVKEAIRLKSMKKYDQVWVVFDRDAFTPEHFNNAITLANANNIQVAYYLDTGITREDYCSQLGRPNFLGKKYEKNSETIFDDLLARQSIAIRHAKKLLEQYNPPNPVSDKPSTTVHLLVEQLNRLVWH